MLRNSILIVLLLSIMILSACTGSYGMQHQSYIVAIGLDYTDDEKVELSLLSLLTDSSQQTHSEGGGGAGLFNVKVISTTCEKFADCFVQLQNKLFGRFITDKAQYILIHHELLEKGIEKYIDYLIHLGEIEQSINIFTTDQKVSEFLENEGGEAISRLLGGMEFHPILFDVQMWEFAPKLYTSLQSAYLPSLSIVQDENKQNNSAPLQHEIEVTGVSLLKKDELIMVIPREDAEWFRLLLKEKINDLTILLQDGDVAYRIQRHRLNVNINESEINITLRLNGWLMSGFADKDKNSVKDLMEAEAVISKEVKRNLQKVIEMTTAEGVDFLRIGEKFRQRNWDTTDWEEKIKTLPIHVTVKTKILSGYGGR